MNKRPAIRFRGYTKDWEQELFSDFAETRRGLTYSPSDVHDNGIRVLRSSNIDENRFVIDNSDVFVSPEAINIPFAQNGDILITAANGSTRLVGKHAIIHNIVSSSTVHGGFMLLASTSFPNFVNALMSAPWYSKFISLYVAGGNGAIGNLNKNDLDRQLVHVPEDMEKRSIGDCFGKVDLLIELHKRKYDKLLTYKKAMLEKMFPKDGADVPEVRFAGFEKAWPSYRIGDVVSDVKRPVVLQDDETYQLVTVKRRNEGIVSRGSYAGKEILVKTYFEVREGDYLVSKRQIVHGANGLVPNALDRAVVSNEYLVIVSNDTISTQFWTLISKTPMMYKFFFVSSYGVDIEKLVFDVDDWKARSIRIPERAEQDKLVAYFGQLDHLIASHQEKLDRLLKLKQALLDKMFI